MTKRRASANTMTRGRSSANANPAPKRRLPGDPGGDALRRCISILGSLNHDQRMKVIRALTTYYERQSSL